MSPSLVATRPLTSAPAIPAALPVVGATLTTPLVNGTATTYAGLDVAATAPALQAVADRVTEALPFYASAHRGSGFASVVSTDLYEASRQSIATFVGAGSDDVVIITRNTTDALTLLSSALPPGSSVVHLDLEHHANLLPWRTHDTRCVSTQSTVAATLVALEDELRTRPTTLLTVTGASNVTGEALPLRRLAELAHAYGARICVDAAQLAPHRRIDITRDGIDYVAISGHKLYAPFGSGALIGRRDWLDVAPAYLPGGGAVSEVTTDSVEWATAPARHEGGSPNVIGAAALAAACDTLAALPTGFLEEHETALLARLNAGLDSIEGITRLSIWSDAPDRVAVASFVVNGFDSAQVAAFLGAEHGIGVRDGRFCAHPLLARLSPDGTAVRASLGAGSTSEHVDRLLAALRALSTDGPSWSYKKSGARWVPVSDNRDLNPLHLTTRSSTPVEGPCDHE